MAFGQFIPLPYSGEPLRTAWRMTFPQRTRRWPGLFRFTIFWEKISVIIEEQRPVVIKMIWEDLDRDSVRSRSEREGVIADHFVDGGQAVFGRARKPERTRSWWWGVSRGSRGGVLVCGAGSEAALMELVFDLTKLGQGSLSAPFLFGGRGGGSQVSLRLRGRFWGEADAADVEVFLEAVQLEEIG